MTAQNNEPLQHFIGRDDRTYELGVKLGGGGYADVVEAYPIAKGGIDYQNPLALKLFKQDASRLDFDGFNRENAAMLRIGDHPNIVRSIDYGVGDIHQNEGGGFARWAKAYILMEYADGGSITNQAPLPLYQSARMGHQVLWALGSLHRWGMVHRDVKPDNILVTGERAQPTFKLADFGAIDRAYQGTKETLQREAIGTQRYVPKEIHEWKATERSDIYSLGLAIAEAATNLKAQDKRGRVARLEELAEEAGIPRDKTLHDLGAIIVRATQEDPRDRYATATEMQKELSRVMNDAAHGADPKWKYRPLRGRQSATGSVRGTKNLTRDDLGVPSARATRGVTHTYAVVEEVVDGEMVPMATGIDEVGQEPDAQMVSAKPGNTVGDQVYGALESAWGSMQNWAQRRFYQRQVVPPLERGQPADRDILAMPRLQGAMAEKLNSVQAMAERRYGQREVSASLEYDASLRGLRVRFNKPLPNIAGVFKSATATTGRWVDGRLDKIDAWVEKKAAENAAAKLRTEEGRGLNAQYSEPSASPWMSNHEIQQVMQEVRRAAASSASNGGNIQTGNNSPQWGDVSHESKLKLGRRHFLILGTLAAAAGGGMLGKEAYDWLKTSDVSDTVFALEEFIPKGQGDFQISTAQAFMDKYEPFYALRMIEHLEKKGMIDEAAVAAQRFADDDPLSARRVLRNLRNRTDDDDNQILSRLDDYSAVLALHNPEIVQKLQAHYKPGNHMRQFYQVALMPERSRKNLSVLQDYVSGNNYWHPKQLAPVLAVRNPELLLGFANDIANSKAVYRDEKDNSDSAFALLNTIAEEFIPNNPVAADKLMRKIEDIVRESDTTQYPLQLALRFASFHPQTAYNALQRYQSYGDAWKGSGDILRIALASHFDDIKSPEGPVGKAWFAYASDPRDKALKTQAMEALRNNEHAALNARWLGLALLRGQTARYK